MKKINRKELTRRFMKESTEVTPMHDMKDCKGKYCPFHNPSDHHMKDWKKVVRYDRGGMTERICKHGCGHPDPDSLAWMKRVGIKDDGTHGCCGCCSTDPYHPIKQLEEIMKCKSDKPKLSKKIKIKPLKERHNKYFGINPVKSTLGGEGKLKDRVANCDSKNFPECREALASNHSILLQIQRILAIICMNPSVYSVNLINLVNKLLESIYEI